MGELARAYAAADAIVLGGTFCQGRGGHNPYEAAATGRPVIVGPHFLQPDADDLLSAGRLWPVQTEAFSLAEAIERAAKAPVHPGRTNLGVDPVKKTLSCLAEWGLLPETGNR